MDKKAGILKIFFMILILIVILVVVFGVITYLQLRPLLKEINDNTTSQDFNALMNGNCSKLQTVEIKIGEIKSNLKYSCMNPVINFVITRNSPEGKNPCVELINQESTTSKALESVRQYCMNKTAVNSS